MDVIKQHATPENVKLALIGVYIFAGAPKALGLANKPFKKDFGLPSFIAIGSGVAELAGAGMLYKGGDLFAHGVLILAAVMGGAMLCMARSPTPAAAVFPAGFTYALFFLLAAAKQAQPAIFAAAVAAGVVGGLVFAKPAGKKGKAAAPKKAVGKKAR